MKLFNLDCHISVIADLKKIFEDLGHSVDSWSISGHNWVFDREPTEVDIINQNSWQHIDKDMCDNFYDRYSDELSIYDAFICTYPISFSMLYEKFKKPIILQIPIRYETPFYNDASKWDEFNQYLRKGIDEGMIIPVANSDYDKKYFEFFVNRECELIPNICDYTKTNWNPTINKFLYYSRLPITLNDSIIDKNSLGKYKWEDIASYKGIVMIPYTCSTMSIFEYYTSNIPLFCPSKKFICELYEKYNNYVLSELTWNGTFRLISGSVIECDRTRDPNDYTNINIMSEWIEYSDFYNEKWMPYITYFDSFEELSNILDTTNIFDISKNMKEFNILRKERIYDKWDNILQNITK